ncbi:MAG: GtrA family protein [Clostridia bacterium]|nr:GtrA family protein [Clostridia bacterium]
MKEFLYLLLHFKKNELFILPTENGFVQFFRFVFVGGIATVVDILIATATYEWLGLKSLELSLLGFDGGLLLANAFGFLIGLATNYILSIIWIFRYQNINRVKEFLSFALIGIMGLAIKLITVGLLERFVFNMNASLLGLVPMVTVVAAIGTLVAFIWNFLARKLFLYSDKNIERIGK